MESKRVPEIRFEGFSGDWEERKLGELYEKNIERNNGQFSTDKTLSIATMRFKPEGNGADQESLKKYKVLRVGDIAYEGHKNKQFSFGRFVLNDVGDGIMSPRFTTLRPIKQMNNLFWKQYIIYEPIMKYILVKSTKLGTMMNELVLNDFFKLILLIPSEKEQSDIGSFFSQLDKAITLHQQNLENLKTKKKGLLQKMFPKEGEKVPELRFPGFTGEWTSCKLGEIAIITMGQSPSSEYYMTESNLSNHILVQGNADMKNGHVVPRIWTSQVTKMAEEGALILSVRAPVGDIGKTGYKVVLGRGVAAIEGENNEFLFQKFEKMKQEGFWNRVSTGSTFESINATDIKEAIVELPNETEQQKIGQFFKQLDDKIALEERELELLKETKEAFLQKMFV